MLALYAALLSAPHPPRKNALRPSDSEGLRNSDLELHDLFREHRRTSRFTTPPSKPGCAASCKGLINSIGQFRSYLFYDDNSRAGLSDRAWGLAHLMALGNALCARPAVRKPSEVLSVPHNGGLDIPPHWWWTRYFSGIESLTRYDNYSAWGTPKCLPDGAPLASVNGTTIIGPSLDEAAVSRDLARAASSSKPFSWCLGYNIRVYLGAAGFDGLRADVPHDWCTMPEAWLGGSEDAMSKSLGEMSLGPSLWVEDLALRVTDKLKLAQWNLPADVLREQAAAEQAKPWEWKRPWDPKEKKQASIQSVMLAKNGCLGSKCNRWTPTADGPCTAHHGDATPCCGQDELDHRDEKDVRPCPNHAPVCLNYRYNKHVGKCTVRSQLTKTQAAKQVRREGCSGSNCKLTRNKAMKQANTRWNWPWDTEEEVKSEECSGSACDEQDPGKGLYALHVRRSDTVDQCDTSLQAVLSYMSCPEALAAEATNQTLIIFTDESDQGYIDSLLTGLATLPRWGGGVAHGDSIVREMLDGADRTDNYLVYSVGSLLMSRADQFFAMERCSGQQDCGNILPVRLRG